MKPNMLVRAALVAGLLVSFSVTFTACCNCGDDEEFSKKLGKELDKEFEKQAKKEKMKLPPKKKKDIAKKVVKKDTKTAVAKKDTKLPVANNAAVAKMTPKKLKKRIKKLGWKILSKPTTINKKSITIPVIKGTTGGAVSLNEFDIEIATDAFYKTMAKNEGAAIARSGNKVVSVVMPGKKKTAEKLLKKLLK